MKKILVNTRLNNRPDLAGMYWRPNSLKAIGALISNDDTGNYVIDPAGVELDQEFYDVFTLDHNEKITPLWKRMEK